jgi:hypothetical protein
VQCGGVEVASSSRRRAIPQAYGDSSLTTT